MLPKKSNKANLENKRSIFLQAGLIITLLLVLAAFEWTSSTSQVQTFEINDGITIDEDIIINTKPEEIKPTPPPLPKLTEIINILDDDDPIINEYIIEDVEATPEMEFELLEDDYDDEEIEIIDFQIVEDKPSFQGQGEYGFRIWVAKNLQYPEIAAENGISGKVFVKFVINTKGEVEDAVVLRSVDPSLDSEALRVIMSSPKWSPGKQRGKPVSVIFKMPINFVLQ